MRNKKQQTIPSIDIDVERHRRVDKKIIHPIFIFVRVCAMFPILWQNEVRLSSCVPRMMLEALE